jgi:hypothetical protein
MSVKNKKPKIYTNTDLLGNQDGSLDHFLLHSSKFFSRGEGNNHGCYL